MSMTLSQGAFEALSTVAKANHVQPPTTNDQEAFLETLYNLGFEGLFDVDEGIEFGFFASELAKIKADQEVVQEILDLIQATYSLQDSGNYRATYDEHFDVYLRDEGVVTTWDNGILSLTVHMSHDTIGDWKEPTFRATYQFGTSTEVKLDLSSGVTAEEIAYFLDQIKDGAKIFNVDGNLVAAAK